MSLTADHNRPKWFAIAVIGLVFVTLACVVRCFLWTNDVRGDVCVKCGAHKIERRRGLWPGVFFQESMEITPSAIASFRSKYLGECPHDWTMNYINIFKGWPKSGFYADSFPGQRYPLAQLPEQYLPALEALSSDSEKIAALRALGSRDNYLRWLTADALRRPSDSLERTLERRWRVNSNLYRIETNVPMAQRFLDELDPATTEALQYGIARCRDLIDMAARRNTNK